MSQNRTKDAAYVDDFQTPPNVADYMAGLVKNTTGMILEPTPGLGNLVAALACKGMDVYSPSDYWNLDFDARFSAVVCNLPFSSKTFKNCPAEYEGRGMVVSYYQLWRLMEMADEVVALMPWFTISDSDVRLRALYDYGLISVTALPRKTFNYARIQTCVLHLQKGYKGKTEFIVFDRLNTQK